MKWTVASRTLRDGAESTLVQRDLAPADLAARCPPQVQLDDRLRRPGGGLVRPRDLGPAPAVRLLRVRELRLGHGRRATQVGSDRGLIQGDLLPPRVPPVDLGHDAPPRDGHALRPVGGLEAIGLTPRDREGLRPVAVEAVSMIGLDDEAAPGLARLPGLVGEVGPDLVARGGGRPAIRSRLGRAGAVPDGASEAAPHPLQPSRAAHADRRIETDTTRVRRLNSWFTFIAPPLLSCGHLGRLMLSRPLGRGQDSGNRRGHSAQPGRGGAGCSLLPSPPGEGAPKGRMRGRALASGSTSRPRMDGPC